MRILGLIILFLEILTGTGARAANSNLSLKQNAELHADFMQTIRDAALDDTSVTAALAQKYPGVNAANIPDGLFAFESAILEVYLTQWKERDFETFTKQWGFSPDESFDISVYYGLRIFIDAVANTEDPTIIFNRLRELSRQRLIAENQTEYDYLRTRITRLSVPEMAAEMNKSQLYVYGQLRDFGLSITSAFNREVTATEAAHLREALTRANLDYILPQIPTESGALEQLRRIELAGVDFNRVLSIAEQVFGFGRQALRFIAHNQKIRDRGVSWERAVEFEGSICSEVETLVRLQGRGLSYQQIAEQLNFLFPPRNDNDFRTEYSVVEKFLSLGRARQKSVVTDVYQSQYGYLYKSGRFVPPLMLKYFIDHRDKSTEWMSEQLGVPCESIEAFAKAQKVDLILTENSDSRLRRALSRYQKQVLVMQKTMDWMSRNHGELPAAHLLRDITNFPLDAIASRRTYGSQGSQSGIFRSLEDFYLSLKAFAAERGVSVPLLSVELLTKGPEFEQIQKDEILSKMFDAIQANEGKPPSTKQYPVYAGRITGKHGLFESSFEFWRAYKEYSAQKGVEFFLIHGLRGVVEHSVNKILQQETLELATRWIRAHDGQLPNGTAFSNDLGINMDRALGRSYSNPKRAELRIFDSPIDFYRQLKAYAAQQGVVVWLLDAKLGTLDAETRKLLQEEALILLEDWMKNPELPADAYPTHKLMLKYPFPKVTWARLTGTTDWGPGKPYHGHQIFDSIDEMRSRLKERLSVSCARRLEDE